MSFTTKTRAVRLISAGVAAASAFSPIVAQANTSINATQLSVTVAPISATGTTLGSQLNALGSGLAGGAALPTFDATGAMAVGTAMNAAANTTFNLDITVRVADTAPVATNMSSTVSMPTSNFGYQSGFFSDSAANAGTLAINGTVASIDAGTRIGSSATAIFSSTLGTDIGESQVRRIATSGNDQSSFEATRQSAVFQFGGSGLTAVSNGGFVTAAALGTAPTITVANGGAVQDGVAFTQTSEIQTAQGTANITSNSTALQIPGYGEVTSAYGGTTAGAITPTSINAMGVTGGGAGTTATLSLIQSLSVFTP